MEIKCCNINPTNEELLEFKLLVENIRANYKIYLNRAWCLLKVCIPCNHVAPLIKVVTPLEYLANSYDYENKYICPICNANKMWSSLNKGECIDPLDIQRLMKYYINIYNNEDYSAADQIYLTSPELTSSYYQKNLYNNISSLNKDYPKGISLANILEELMKGSI